MEANIKTKFNIGDTVWTIEEGGLRIIHFCIESILARQVETSQRGVYFDKKNDKREREGFISTAISYSDYKNAFTQFRNVGSGIGASVQIYHEEDCFATKQELITYLLSQQ